LRFPYEEGLFEPSFTSLFKTPKKTLTTPFAGSTGNFAGAKPAPFPRSAKEIPEPNCQRSIAAGYRSPNSQSPGHEKAQLLLLPALNLISGSFDPFFLLTVGTKLSFNLKSPDYWKLCSLLAVSAAAPLFPAGERT